MNPSKLILDPKSVADLGQVPNGTELCDASGRTIGVFVSPDLYQQMRQAWEQQAYDEKVAQEAEADYRAGRWRTTAEVLEYLKTL